MSSTAMRSNSERFLEAFNEIEDLLAERNSRRIHSDKTIPFWQLVDTSKDLVDRQRRELKQCAKLRNAIVHDPRDRRGEPIADPREGIVIWLEQQVDVIANPPKVKDVLKLQPPQVLSEGDDLSTFFAQIKPPLEYSQSPVRTDVGGLLLVTTNAVARWLASSYDHGVGVALESARLREITDFSEDADRLVVKPRNLTAVEAVRIFAGRSSGVAPAAIALTETGDPKQKPLGLCVRADVADLLVALGV